MNNNNFSRVEKCQDLFKKNYICGKYYSILKEYVTIIHVTCEPKEDLQTSDNNDFCKKLCYAMEDGKDKIIIIGNLNARAGKKDEESSFVIRK